MTPAHILLIEDDTLVAEALQLMLEFRGYRVTCVDNGSAGLKAVQREQPDLIITDMVLPELDGVSLLRAIRTQNPTLPVLAISGMGPEHGDLYLNLAAKLGANAVLRKPVRATEICTAIERLLAAKSLAV